MIYLVIILAKSPVYYMYFIFSILPQVTKLLPSFLPPYYKGDFYPYSSTNFFSVFPAFTVSLPELFF